MNGKQRAQQIESRRQLNWDHSDAEISRRARSVLRWKTRYDSIRVTAEKGQVTLLGEVNWDLDREAAEQTVRKLSGVVSVTNLLTTKVCAVRHA
jgi:osmotically-inducible protein OsmY